MTDKHLVIHSTLSFDAKDVRTTVKQLSALSAKLGGYIAEEQIDNHLIAFHNIPISNAQKKVLSSYQQIATLTARTPKDKVGEFLENLQTKLIFYITKNLVPKMQA